MIVIHITATEHGNHGYTQLWPLDHCNFWQADLHLGIKDLFPVVECGWVCLDV